MNNCRPPSGSSVSQFLKNYKPPPLHVCIEETPSSLRDEHRWCKGTKRRSMKQVSSTSGIKTARTTPPFNFKRGDAAMEAKQEASRLDAFFSPTGLRKGVWVSHASINSFHQLGGFPFHLRLLWQSFRQMANQNSFINAEVFPPTWVTHAGRDAFAVCRNSLRHPP